MNRQESDVLITLWEEPYINQRILAENCGYSLGVVNRSIKNLEQEGYLDSQLQLTNKAVMEFGKCAPRNAIILAAGLGMRMVPINMEVSKGLLEINKETLIERIIRQLHEAHIFEIYVVVGFMKEQYEYLIDEYGVELVVNPEYMVKNNLHSLKLVQEYLYNTYIIPCDIWCAQNPFRKRELYSWYMVSDVFVKDSNVRVNRKQELVMAANGMDGNAIIGICYLLEAQAAVVRRRMAELCRDRKFDNSFWEETLYKKNRMIVQAKVVCAAGVVEINTYEQLRELDRGSGQLKSDALEVITEVFHVEMEDIKDIVALKKGMTNCSFLFTCRGKKYIMRIPGEGTERLIDREQESAVYQMIAGKDICDDTLYLDPGNGYKITEFLEGARVCNPLDEDDLAACMKKLRNFHEMALTVQHSFDIFGQIDFYESLWEGKASIYRDYQKTKKHVFSLRAYIEENVGERVLTHIDAIPDNFLLFKEGGEEKICLIDWEYAGMQDPHVDIAMFCIYAMYNRKQVDHLIDLYFEGRCLREIRMKIYCYISACGLLWSNWCEYKRSLGVDFGEYSIRQYRFAKDYYKIVCEELGDKRGN